MAEYYSIKILWHVINFTFQTADQLIAGSSILSRPAEEFDNDVSKVCK